MNDIQHETLGNICRLCEQMAYAAEHNHTEMLKAQYLALSKYMKRLNMIDKLKEA